MTPGALLTLIPRSVLAGLLVIALAGAGWQSVRLHAAEHDLRDLQLALAQAQAEAERVARAEETRRAAAITEVQTHARRQIARAQADAAGARAAADSLRQRAAEYASAAACDPAAATGGDAAPGPGLVLADLLGRAADRAVELAAAADQARAAGDACQRAYNALMPP